MHFNEDFIISKPITGWKMNKYTWDLVFETLILTVKFVIRKSAQTGKRAPAV